MLELTNPAAGPVALPAKVAPPTVLAPGVPSLAAFVDLMIGELTPPAAKPAPGSGKRQDDADSGKILPNGEQKTAVDPALAWLFGQVPLPTASATDSQTQPADTVASTATQPFPLPGTAGPAVSSVLAAIEPDPAQTAPPIFLPTLNPSLEGKGKVEAGPVLPDPRIGPVQSPQPMPTAQPISAVLPALFALAMTPDREHNDITTPAVAPPTTPIQPAILSPVGDTQRQSLDLGNRDWPQKMIDHIEALRDNANANDTSIRLKPDALGRVDVSLRTHDDGAISVRFMADQPTTRTLLADAAPQLTAAAEARGIRLSGTSVDLSQQGDQRRPAQADQPQNISNHLAAPRGDDTQAVDDGRIA